MGLFNNGVAQVEYDRLKEDFNILKFTNSLEEMKAAHAINFSDMKYSIGKACGMIDAVSELVEAKLISTASSLFDLVENNIVESINDASKSHRVIIESMEGFSPEISAAYIQHLSKDTLPLHTQVNNVNDLIRQSINMLDSLRNVLRG